PYVEGTVLYIGPKKGEEAKINEVIAVVGEEGESYEELLEEEKEQQEEESSDAEEEEEKEKEKPAAEKEESADKKVDKGALEEAEKNATAVRMPLLSDTMKEGKIV